MNCPRLEYGCIKGDSKVYNVKIAKSGSKRWKSTKSQNKGEKASKIQCTTQNDDRIGALPVQQYISLNELSQLLVSKLA